MRLFTSYRAAIRNAWRRKRVIREGGEDLGNAIRFWRFSEAAMLANVKAKLKERAAQCAEARNAVLAWIVKNGMSTLHRSLPVILSDYWRTQKRTRVVSRLLRELAVPAAA